MANRTAWRMFPGQSARVFYACVAVTYTGASRLRRGDPNRELGQTVGGLIRESDQQLAANAGRGNAVSPAYHPSLANSLSADQEVLVNAKVSEAIAQANSAAAREILPADSFCERNWARLCPDGWAMVGASCVAPTSYAGPCKNTESFVHVDAMGKYRFSTSCNAPWQCVNDTCEHGRDYDACPSGWTSRGDGFCQSSADGTATCGNAYKIDIISVGEKQELSRVCGLTWPCTNGCERDYTQPCPQEWSNVLGLCMAPATYAGDCGFSMNTTGMSAQQKRDIASKCETQFACAGAANELPGESGARSDEMGNGPIDSRADSVVGQ